MHSVSTLSEQTTPTWKNVSDTNFQARPVAAGVGSVRRTRTKGHPDTARYCCQVTNVQLEDLDLDFQQLGGSITWEPCQDTRPVNPSKQGSSCNLGRVAALFCVGNILKSFSGVIEQ